MSGQAWFVHAETEKALAGHQCARRTDSGAFNRDGAAGNASGEAGADKESGCGRARAAWRIEGRKS